MCNFLACLLSGLGVVSLSCTAQAQLIPDTSLGLEASRVETQNHQTHSIQGGAMRGNSLFHSFEAFNVSEGRSLYFSPDHHITHIFSRITGDTPSKIDGTLGVRGEADLFLLNPNGILFGPHARLDLSGSLLASTAESIQFEGFRFAAISPQPIPLLTISRPLGFQLGRDSGSIINQSQVNQSQVNQSQINGAGLTIQPFETLALIGGDIQLIEGNLTSQSGRIELGSVRHGSVGLTPNGSGWALDYGDGVEQGRLQLRDRAVIQSISRRKNPDSIIRLVADEILLSEESRVVSSTEFNGLGTAIELQGDRIELLTGAGLLTQAQAGTGGTITVNAAENLLIKASRDRPPSGTGLSSIIQSDTLPHSSAQGGAIDIQTQQLRVEDGGQIFSTTGFFSTGSGGEVRIRAGESIRFQNLIPTEFRTSVATETRGSGQGGHLNVSTAQLQFDRSYTLGSASWLDGDGGDVSIEAHAIDLDAANAFSSRFVSGIGAFAYGSGDGGDIRLKVQDLRVANSAYVTTAVFAERAATAELFSRIYDPAFARLIDQPDAGTGNAGNVDVVANSIEVAGINPAPDATPSGILSLTTGPGHAGNVDITTQHLNIIQGGTVGSSTAFSFSFFGKSMMDTQQGHGGNLTVNSDRIVLKGMDAVSGLPSSLVTQTVSSGNAGKNTINTRELIVKDGALVAAGTFTSGKGGQLVVNATELIRVDGMSSGGDASTIGTFAATPNPALQRFFFLSSEEPSGDTGQLALNTDRLEIRHGGLISVAHKGNGNAGQLDINARQLELSHQGLLSASSFSGQGGNVNLQIDEILLLRQGGQITAEAMSGTGDGGNLAIAAGSILAIPDENSDIIANAHGGNGGNVSLRTGKLLGLEFQEQLTPQSDITASSKVGLNGSINIDLLAVDPHSGVVELPVALLNSDEPITTSCRYNSDSRFVASGRGGLPTDPRHQLSWPQPLEDWRQLGSVVAISPPVVHRKTVRALTSQKQTRPIEAAGWQIDAEQKIHLVPDRRFSANLETETSKTCGARGFG